MAGLQIHRKQNTRIANYCLQSSFKRGISLILLTIFLDKFAKNTQLVIEFLGTKLDDQ